MASERLVPMKKEQWNFFEKQRSLFSSMNMDDDWNTFDAELDRIKKDMFKLTPMDMGDFGSSLMPSMGSGFGSGFDSAFDTGSSSSSSSKTTKKTTTTTTKSTKITSSSSGGADPMSSFESNFGSSMNTTFGSSMDAKMDAALKDAGFGSGFGSTALDTSSLSSSSALDKYMLKVDKPFVTDMDGNKKLSLKFDMSDFKPEEITLKTVDNRLMVGAKHLEETATSSIYREFSKQYVLPVKIDPLALSSVLTKDGVLSVEAPAPEALEAPRERILPIQKLL